MLPDSILGGLTLSVVNMVVVFFMLGALCVVIQLIHKGVSVLGLDSDVVAHPVVPTPAAAPARTEDGLLNMEARVAGAVVAEPVVNVSPESKANAGPTHFLRDIKDSGAWGKSGRPKIGGV